MERDEVERVERELDEILSIVQPDQTARGSDIGLTGEHMQKRKTKPDSDSAEWLDEDYTEDLEPGARRRAAGPLFEADVEDEGIAADLEALRRISRKNRPPRRERGSASAVNAGGNAPDGRVAVEFDGVKVSFGQADYSGMEEANGWADARYGGGEQDFAGQDDGGAGQAYAGQDDGGGRQGEAGTDWAGDGAGRNYDDDGEYETQGGAEAPYSQAGLNSAAQHQSRACRSRKRQDYAGSDRNDPGGGQDYAGKDRNDPYDEENYAGAGRNYSDGGQDYANEDQDYPGDDQGYAGSAQDYPNGDQDYAEENQGYARADRDYAEKASAWDEQEEDRYLEDGLWTAEAAGNRSACEGVKSSLHILKASDGLLAAFFVPVIVMIIVFAQRGIFPFGEESFLRTDMYHQYAPFFSEFQYKLTHGGSLLYSWDIGMGVNFSALYAYYLASPFNWLLVLCPKAYIIEFMSYGIVLKIGLAGLSFAWYLRRHCRTKDFGVGFFGIFYALSGYMAAYSWNIMWLDCIILFPLIMLGLERLVRKRKPFLYCLTLGAAILSNYYISIMICIFMVMYFIALMILYPPKKAGEFFAACGQFAAFSLAAGGLAAVVLLPEIYALQTTASGNFDFPKTLSSYFPIFDMLARHIGNVSVEIGLDHWPNIYCGVAVFIFFLLYLASRKIALREKAVYCTLLILFFASFSTNMLNFIWHGFHYPNSLPCRQSFIYIALMLLICYRAYMYLDVTPWRHVAIAFWGSACFVILAEKLVDNKEQFHFSVFYVALLFLALYTGLIYLYKRRRKGADVAVLLALAVVSIESAVNTTVTSVPTTSRTAYTRDNKDVITLMSEVTPQTFYRVEKVDRKTKNDGAWMNFPSVSLFSSTANASLSDFFRKLGCESSTNAYSITGSTPLVDSLFSVKYGLYDKEQVTGELLSFAGRRGDTWLYENLYTLPVAFMLPKDVESNWIMDTANPAYVQNDLCSVLDTSPVLVGVDTVPNGSKLTFTPDVTGDYYVYVTSRKIKEVTAVVGSQSMNFDNVDRGYLLELGTCTAGSEVSLESRDEGNVALQVEVWRFDPQGFKELYSRLNQNPMSVTKWTDVSVEGTIVADAPGVMYTSIPYDKGWSVKVDGNSVTARPLFDTFLGVDLSAGAHTVSLSYEPEGLRTGAIITAGSAAFVGISAAVYFAWNRRKKEES